VRGRRERVDEHRQGGRHDGRRAQPRQAAQDDDGLGGVDVGRRQAGSPEHDQACHEEAAPAELVGGDADREQQRREDEGVDVHDVRQLRLRRAEVAARSGSATDSELLAPMTSASAAHMSASRAASGGVTGAQRLLIRLMIRTC
jgi:hypothetical protein